MSVISCECADNQLALSTLNIRPQLQRSTLNIQRSTLNAQRSMRSSKISLALMLTTALGWAAASSASAGMISIFPSKDNTLYEYNPNEGDLSNALGNHFFTGTTVFGEIRRGVLAFDI